MINKSSHAINYQTYRTPEDVQALRNAIASLQRVDLFNPSILLEVIPDVCDALFAEQSGLLELTTSLTLRSREEVDALLAALKRQRPPLVKFDLHICYHEDRVQRRAADFALDLMEALAAWPALEKLKLRVYGEDSSRRHPDGRKWLMEHAGDACVAGRAWPDGFLRLKKLSVDTTDRGMTPELLSQFYLTLPAIEVVKTFFGGTLIKVPRPHTTKAAKRA